VLLEFSVLNVALFFRMLLMLAPLAPKASCPNIPDRFDKFADDYLMLFRPSSISMAGTVDLGNLGFRTVNVN
jgi:hypothetical protein